MIRDQIAMPSELLVRQVAGAAAAGNRQGCLQLPHDATADSTLSVFRHQSDLGPDSNGCRQLYRGQALGIIRGSFVYADAGRQPGTINSLREVASPSVNTALVLLGILALAPVLYKKFALKRT
jgi:hypothetical protein